MQFILPRAIQCSSGTTGPESAPQRHPKHQFYLNLLSPPRERAQGTTRLPECAGGGTQCLGPSWMLTATRERGRAAAEALPNSSSSAAG